MSYVQYSVDFAVDDTDPLQETLNDLYRYADDIATKVLHRNRLNLFYLLMRALIARGIVSKFAAALDVGCNAGVYCKILHDLGFKSVLGFDSEPELVARANDAFAGPGIEFRVGDAEAFAGSYDFVLCTEVVEHTSQPLRVIDNIKGALKPGGIAVVSLPNRVSLPYIVKWVTYRLRRQPITGDFASHLAFPFYRSIRLFSGDETVIRATDGTNLIFNTPVLKALYRSVWFEPLNRWTFRLARIWPLKYVSQFFFLVVEKRSA